MLVTDGVVDVMIAYLALAFWLYGHVPLPEQRQWTLRAPFAVALVLYDLPGVALGAELRVCSRQGRGQGCVRRRVGVKLVVTRQLTPECLDAAGAPDAVRRWGDEDTERPVKCARMILFRACWRCCVHLQATRAVFTLGPVK